MIGYKGGLFISDITVYHFQKQDIEHYYVGMGKKENGDYMNDAIKLQEAINGWLSRTATYGNGLLKLSKNTNHFVEMVLSIFDEKNKHQLSYEVVALAGGEVGISDSNLPAGYQRTVIREALSDLHVLDLVQTLTDPTANITTLIPYENRDTSAVLGDGIVFEGAPISRASTSQAMDTAYLLAVKIGFIITNEVAHFSRASSLDWDAYARSVESNARFLRELIVRRLCREMQRGADAFGATAVTGENIAARLDGSNSVIKTASFPLVRQHQTVDLQGNSVGSIENPIALVIDSTAITEHDGSNTQSPGTYYRVTNYNLGYIQLVSELGAAVTPTATTATLGYSYAVNALLFDLDNGSTPIEQHLNGLLRAIGSRKAGMQSDRFTIPNFMLMNPAMNDTVTNAELFTVSGSKKGSALTNDGDLEMIKGIPAFSTNVVGSDLGEERIIMGARGTLSYIVAKPFATGKPFQVVDGNGKAVGKLQAYGEEYSAMKVPAPIRGRLTSVVAYSATARSSF